MPSTLATSDTDLAARVRTALAGTGEIREVKMFGGIGFMLNGNMVAAASKRGLLLRVGKEQQEKALSWPGTRPMEMRGRVMEGYVYVDPPALADADITSRLHLACAYVQTLPHKAKDTKTPAKKAKKPRKIVSRRAGALL
jgi:TfoX/Sxy family transcriptional regulator of competence genes